MLPFIPLLSALIFLTPQPPAAPPVVAETKTAVAAPVIDLKAEALLAANGQAMLSFKSYSAERWATYTFPPSDARPKGGTEYQMSVLAAPLLSCLTRTGATAT